MPKQQLDELSQAVDLTTNKFEKLLKSTEDMIKKSVQNPGEASKAQEQVTRQIEDKCFDLINNMFNRLGG